MSEIENALPNENRSSRPGRTLTKIEKQQDILLVVSLAQLILAMLLYLLGFTKLSTLAGECLAVIALALLAHFKYENKAVRIVLRIIGILLIAVPLIFSAVFIALYYGEATLSQNADALVLFQADSWLTFAVIALPSLLFMQPVFVVNAFSRRRFDMVMLRIVSILTLLFCIVLCTLAFEYKPDGQQVIFTTQAFSWNLFGHSIDFTLAVDSIFTRILLCLCSAALIFFSFRIPSIRKEKAQKANV